MIEDVVFDYLELLTIIGVAKGSEMYFNNKALVNKVSKYSLFSFVGFKTYEYIRSIMKEFYIDDLL